MKISFILLLSLLSISVYSQHEEVIPGTGRPAFFPGAKEFNNLGSFIGRYSPTNKQKYDSSYSLYVDKNENSASSTLNLDNNFSIYISAFGDNTTYEIDLSKTAAPEIKVECIGKNPKLTYTQKLIGDFPLKSFKKRLLADEILQVTGEMNQRIDLSDKVYIVFNAAELLEEKSHMDISYNPYIVYSNGDIINQINLRVEAFCQ